MKIDKELLKRIDFWSLPNPHVKTVTRHRGRVSRINDSNIARKDSDVCSRKTHPASV